MNDSMCERGEGQVGRGMYLVAKESCPERVRLFLAPVAKGFRSGSDYENGLTHPFALALAARAFLAFLLLCLTEVPPFEEAPATTQQSSDRSDHVIKFQVPSAEERRRAPTESDRRAECSRVIE